MGNDRLINFGGVKLLKLKRFVECALSGNNRSLTLSEIRDIERVYSELLQYRKSETIMQKSHDTCIVCGLKVHTKGIGWEVLK